MKDSLSAKTHQRQSMNSTHLLSSDRHLFLCFSTQLWFCLHYFAAQINWIKKASRRKSGQTGKRDRRKDRQTDGLTEWREGESDNVDGSEEKKYFLKTPSSSPRLGGLFSSRGEKKKRAGAKGEIYCPSWASIQAQGPRSQRRMNECKEEVLGDIRQTGGQRDRDR